MAPRGPLLRSLTSGRRVRGYSPAPTRSLRSSAATWILSTVSYRRSSRSTCGTGRIPVSSNLVLREDRVHLGRAGIVRHADFPAFVDTADACRARDEGQPASVGFVAEEPRVGGGGADAALLPRRVDVGLSVAAAQDLLVEHPQVEAHDRLRRGIEAGLAFPHRVVAGQVVAPVELAFVGACGRPGVRHGVEIFGARGLRHGIEYPGQGSARLGQAAAGRSGEEEAPAVLHRR